MSRLLVLTTYCSMFMARVTCGPATTRVKALCSAGVAVASNAVASAPCPATTVNSACCSALAKPAVRKSVEKDRALLGDLVLFQGQRS